MSLNQRIAGFDGIRALAVICVVVQHLGLWQYADQSRFVTDQLMPLFSGSTGVQAFFILSGFLITILLVKEKQTTGTVSIAAFMVRRSLRIFPLYLLFCILATLAFLLLNKQVPWRSLAYAFLYVYNFVPAQEYVSLLGHTWSLAVEEHFYLVWPVVFAFGFVNRNRGLIVGLTAFIVFSLLLHFFLVTQPLASGYFVSRWSFIAGYNIAFGCIGALLVAGSGSKNFNAMLDSPVVLVSGIVLYLNSVYILTDSWFMQNVVCGYIRSVGILLIILWIYRNQASMLVRALDIRPLRYIGTISYGIYMWQGFFLATGPKRLEGEVWPPSPYVGLAMLVIVAPLSYRYFEKPFLNLKKRYSLAASRRLAHANG